MSPSEADLLNAAWDPRLRFRKDTCTRCGATESCTDGAHYPLGWGMLEIHARIPHNGFGRRYETREHGLWCANCLETLGAPKEVT